jgi:nucleotide-binding universal stress UspA family protein
MYDTILVPLDGSKRAEAILPHVQAFGRGAQSKIILLTALEHKMFVSAEGIQSQLDAGELERKMQAAEEYLSNLVEQFRRMDIEAEYQVVYGPAVDVIIKAAEEEDAGLIAIASHGRTGLGRVFYGSIAAGVLQAVDRPLLMVRSRGFTSDATLQWGKDVI